MRILFYREFLNACSYYRCILPGEELKNYGYIVEIKEFITHKDIDNNEIIIFQKKYNDLDFSLLEYAKNKKKIIIYELDDDLFNVPLWNPFYGSISKLRSRYRSFIEKSDYITVTNFFLANQIKRFNKNIFVIPNFLNFQKIFNLENHTPLIYNKLSQKMDFHSIGLQDKIRIGWGGSPTHREDLKLITDSLIYLANRYKNLQIFMILCVDKKLISNINIDQIFLVSPSKLEDYYALLNSLKLDIGLAPLANHIFNKSKSNLKIIEYMSLNIIPIASKIENYEKTLNMVNNNLLISKDNTKSWISQLSTFIEIGDKKMIKDQLFNFCYKNFNIKDGIRYWLSLLNKIGI